jgi:cell division protein FtsB
LAVICFFAYVQMEKALFGKQGLVNSFHVVKTLKQHKHTLAALKAEQAELLQEIQKLENPKSKTLETLARKEFGLGRPGEIIFVFPQEDLAGSP